MDIFIGFYKFIKSIITVSIFFLISSVYANSLNGFYLGGNLGASVSNIGQAQTIVNVDEQQNEWVYEYSKDNDRLRLSALVGITGGYEFSVANNFFIDFGVAAYTGTANSAKGRIDLTLNGETTHLHNYSYDVNSTQLLAETKIKYKNRRFMPFILFGAGTSWNKVGGYSVQDVTGNGLWRAVPFTLADKDAKFAYEIGIGIDYQIYREGYFGIVYRYANLGDTSFDATTDQFSQNIRVGSIITHSVMLGFTHRFQ